MRTLNSVDALDMQLARKITGTSWFAEKGAFSAPVLNSLNSFLHRDTDALRELTVQPWFADGLDEEEAAFVVTLAWVAARNSELYTDLLRTRYTQNRTISLPLAGDANIWIFQNTPFPPAEDLLAVVADTARISEGLLQVPFPTNDIILLVVDDTDRRYNFNYGKHLSGFMVVTRRPTGLRSVRHETAHYYFSGNPQWLGEGGTEFIAAYVRDKTGVQSLSDRKIEASQRVRTECYELNEIENIRHLSYVWGRTSHECPYVMGENLLFNISEILGSDAMTSALRELYELPLDEGSERDKEELVFNTLVKHIPPGRMEEFVDLYRRLHGGPYPDPGADLSDDHGDEAAAATAIAIGEIVEGSLDYHFDFDYFKFRAEQGQRYVISVNHDTLRASSLLLYGTDGQAFERFTDRVRGPSGPRMQWTAPASGDYYFAVHNFGGESGQYTTAITRQGSGS
ncbi:MAG: M1 family metallopeptidase [Chloroflexi bacterium]|nr:M1 family metallopeptidase [Chloroflexota bacterium]